MGQVSFTKNMLYYSFLKHLQYTLTIQTYYHMINTTKFYFQNSLLRMTFFFFLTLKWFTGNNVAS